MISIEESTKVALLKLVADHDGEWGWYQLDRALLMCGYYVAQLPSVMDQLSMDGLVKLSGDSQFAKTRYSITEAGRALVNG
jgi:hypothetical protein